MQSITTVIPIVLLVSLGTPSKQTSKPFEDVKPSASVIGKMPSFRVQDITGKLWGSEDLRGKTTFVLQWAIECIPCRAELPEVQREYNRLANSDRVKILTFSIDQNPKLLSAFLLKYG